MSPLISLSVVYQVGPNTGSATITTAHSATDRSYEIPDTGGTSQFMMTTGDQTLDGKKTLSDLEVKDELPIGGKTGTTYMSAADKGWQRILLSNERKVGEETLKGGILFGHGIRTEDRAEVFINSIGNNVAEIFLGRDELMPANIKWGISSRPSEGATDDNELKIFRGPLLTGGDFKVVLSVDAKTGNITLMSGTDSKSTTTGGVITKGGLGVAKSHVYNAGMWGIDMGAIDSSGDLTLHPGANGIDGWNHVVGPEAAWSNINFTYNVA